MSNPVSEKRMREVMELCRRAYKAEIECQAAVEALAQEFGFTTKNDRWTRDLADTTLELIGEAWAEIGEAAGYEDPHDLIDAL